VEIFLCGEFSRKEVSGMLKNFDFVLSVEHPDTHLFHCENTRCCFVHCDLCGANYDIIYAVKHYSRTCWVHELEYYNDHKHGDKDKTSKWDNNGYTFHPYYVGCRPEMFTNHEIKVMKTTCFSVVVLSRGKVEEMDIIEIFMNTFSGLKDIKIGEIISFSDRNYNFRASSQSDSFKNKLTYTFNTYYTPPLELLMNAQQRCDIPSNMQKTMYRLDFETVKDSMLAYLRLYVKCVTLCCCEGPPSIFCIKYCKEKSLPCCQLCKEDEEKFDTYSEYESEEGEATENNLSTSVDINGNTSINSESD
jgi:hypothetical protein